MAGQLPLESQGIVTRMLSTLQLFPLQVSSKQGVALSLLLQVALYLAQVLLFPAQFRNLGILSSLMKREAWRQVIK